MNRKTFIQQCGFGCIGLLGLPLLTESCSISKSVSGQISGTSMTIPLTEFQLHKGDPPGFKRYLIVRNEALNYPIVVYREDAANYTALLLRCSHQHAELNVNGELLTCSAHGSEFNPKGEVVNGPATAKLRSFSTRTDANNLYIDLS